MVVVATCASSPVETHLESFFSELDASMPRRCTDDESRDGGGRRGRRGGGGARRREVATDAGRRSRATVVRRREGRTDRRKRLVSTWKQPRSRASSCVHGLPCTNDACIRSFARKGRVVARGDASCDDGRAPFVVRRLEENLEKILQFTTVRGGQQDVSHGVVLKRQAPRSDMAIYSVKSTSSFGLTRVHLRRCEGQAKEAVLFFPGDRMESDDELVQRLTDPDGMLDVLEKKFPSRDIMVVQPTRYEPPGQANAYACYDNFLERSTWTGDPIGYHTEQGKGLKHLAAILQEAEAAHGMAEDLSVTLIGFSKGCVVLNQLLTELAVLVDGSSNAGLRSRRRIHAIHFVDAGLNRPGAYPTDMDVAQYLATNGAHVYFHGTPRQWNGLTRAWILEEKSRSLALLREIGAVVVERLYLEDRCYDDHAAHFEILELFDPHIPPPAGQDPCE